MRPQIEWFSADVVVYFQFLEGEQDEVTVWLNTILVQASSLLQARAKAHQLASEEYKELKPSGESWCGTPMRTAYVGIRRVESCPGLDPDGAGGIEISRARYLLRSRSDLEGLLDGDDMAGFYEDLPRGTTSDAANAEGPQNDCGTTQSAGEGCTEARPDDGAALRWWTAHLMFEEIQQEGEAAPVGLQEVLYLIRTPDSESGWSTASEKGKEWERDSQHNRSHDSAAPLLEYVCTLRLVSLSVTEDGLCDGCELTWREMMLRGPQDLPALAAGEQVIVDLQNTISMIRA